MSRLKSISSVIIIFACVISQLHLFAQHEDKIAKLENELSQAREDTNKANLLNDLAWEYREIDAIKLLFYAERGLALSKRIHFRKGEADCWNRIGNYYELVTENDSALSAYKKALTLDSMLGNPYSIGRDYHQLASVKRKLGDYNQSVEFEIKSVEFFEKLSQSKKRDRALASAHNNLGNAYKRQREFQLALKHFKKGLEIREHLDEPKEISKSKNEIALLHQSLGMLKYALDIHQESLSYSLQSGYHAGIATSYRNIGDVYLSLFQFDTALKYYQKSLPLKKKLSDQADYFDLIHHIGMLYQKKGEYDSAYVYFQKSLFAREHSQEKPKIAESLYHIGTVMTRMGRYKDALNKLNESFKITESIKDSTTQALVLEGIAEVYSFQQDSSLALDFYLQSKAITDELSEQKRQALDFDKKLSESQKKMLLKQKDLELQNAAYRSNIQLFFLVLIIGGLLVITGSAIMFSLRNKQKARIEAQNAQISRKEVDDLIKSQELKLMRAMLEGQDEERQRIAGDLHDRLGGILSIVRLHFKSVEKSLNQMESHNRKHYSVASKLLNDACEAVRQISHDIGDKLLLNLGLIPAIQDLANMIQSSQELRVQIVHHGMKERLPIHIEMNLYKIIQELLANILKHAAAEHVTINLLLNKETLSVTVEDDGKGFDLQSGVVIEGMGMYMIQSRIQNLGGAVVFDSQPRHGTTVTIEVPLKTL